MFLFSETGCGHMVIKGKHQILMRHFWCSGVAWCMKWNTVRVRQSTEHSRREHRALCRMQGAGKQRDGLPVHSERQLQVRHQSRFRSFTRLFDQCLWTHSNTQSNQGTWNESSGSERKVSAGGVHSWSCVLRLTGMNPRTFWAFNFKALKRQRSHLEIRGGCRNREHHITLVYGSRPSRDRLQCLNFDLWSPLFIHYRHS